MRRLLGWLALLSLACVSAPQTTTIQGSLMRIPRPPAAGPDAIGPAFPSLSADCRWLAFGLAGDVYLHDLERGATTLMSVAANGARANRPSGVPVLSSDGSHLAFDSAATNLVPGAQNRHDHVFVRSTRSRNVVRASVGLHGGPGNDANLAFHGGLALDGAGSRVAFVSHADDLVSGDSNERIDVFVRDLAKGVTERVSVSSSGAQASGDSSSPALSADGRFVVFASDAHDLVAGDTNHVRDVFLHDRETRETRRLSVAPGGGAADAAADAPAISADGRFVAFVSQARRVLVLDRVAERIEALPAVSGPSDSPAISADGTRVAFVASRGVHLLDRSSGTLQRIDTSPAGAPADEESGGWGITLSAGGTCLAFGSLASNLTPADDDGPDLFLWTDRGNRRP